MLTESILRKSGCCFTNTASACGKLGLVGGDWGIENHVAGLALLGWGAHAAGQRQHACRNASSRRNGGRCELVYGRSGHGPAQLSPAHWPVVAVPVAVAAMRAGMSARPRRRTIRFMQRQEESGDRDSGASAAALAEREGCSRRRHLSAGSKGSQNQPAERWPPVFLSSRRRARRCHRPPRPPGLSRLPSGPRPPAQACPSRPLLLGPVRGDLCLSAGRGGDSSAPLPCLRPSGRVTHIP